MFVEEFEEDQNHTPHTQTHELPLVVWLRGDEDFFSEFSLNADQVMEILGIKRSRLTQISGRELRVGKTRVDRYLKPVFRPQDVDAYAEWTRPTATHKKSSSVVEEACHNLTKHSSVLVEKITSFEEDLLYLWTQQLREHRQGTSAEVQQILSGQTRSLREFLYHQHTRLSDQQSQFASTQRETQAQLEALSPYLDILPNLLTQVQYLAQTQVELQSRMDQIATALKEASQKKQLYRYILAFGSNLGEREAHLQAGLEHMARFGTLIKVTSWIETEPLTSVDYDTQDHQNYINFAVDFATDLTPEELYAQIVFVENARGHDRHQRWKPRALDIDILYWAQNTSGAFLECPQLHWQKEETISNTARRSRSTANFLAIPHREALTRAFWQRLFQELT